LDLERKINENGKSCLNDVKRSENCWNTMETVDIDRPKGSVESSCVMAQIVAALKSGFLFGLGRLSALLKACA
jgi:hypothetical protein